MLKFVSAIIFVFAIQIRAQASINLCEALFSSEGLVEQVVMSDSGHSVEFVPFSQLLQENKNAGEQRSARSSKGVFTALADRSEVQILASRTQKKYEIPEEDKGQINLDNYYGYFDTTERFWIMDKNKGRVVFWKFAETNKLLQKPVVIDGLPEEATDIQAHVAVGPSNHLILIVSYAIFSKDEEVQHETKQYDFHSRSFIADSLEEGSN